MKLVAFFLVAQLIPAFALSNSITKVISKIEDRYSYDHEKRAHLENRKILVATLTENSEGEVNNVVTSQKEFLRGETKPSTTWQLIDFVRFTAEKQAGFALNSAKLMITEETCLEEENSKICTRSIEMSAASRAEK